ncbi:MAG TPA: alkaline shock response membrane anchor protein AmaP [Firmicutes bacterium]|nr:alkaline shock response membrane anchor protein AmaP [Bacillota bacterium]
MRNLERGISLLYILLVMLISALFIGLTAPLSFFDGLRTSFSLIFNNWIYTVAAAAIFILTLYLALQLLFAENKVRFLAKQGEMGEYRISFNTFETLVLHAAKLVKGIKDARTQISLEGNGLLVFLKITAAADNNLPELVNNIQSSVKEHVEKISGVTVAEVNVFVDNIANEVKR